MTKTQITLRDIYDIVNEYNGKIDNRLEKIDERINKIENNQNRALGIISVISLFLSAGASYFWASLLGKK